MGLLTTLSTGAPPSFSGNVDGDIFSVNGIDKPWVRDKQFGVRNWGIAAPPAPSAGSNAAGSLTGDYLWRITWKNSNTGLYGMYVDADSATLAAQKRTINRPSTAGIDSQITHWQLWRTAAGETSTYYLVTTQTTATASYVDDNADATITANETLEEHNPPDPIFRYVKEFKGLTYLYGSRIESTGTVTVANGSANVQGNGTQFNASHVGQKIWFTGDATIYTIDTFAAASGAAAITITPVKSGAVTGVVYKIVAESPSDMASSRADDESFKAEDRWSVFPNDGDFPSGMEIVGNTLCLFKERHIYGYECGLNPNPLNNSAVCYPILQNRGLINEFCLVKVGPTAYLLDRVGIYQFDGAGQAVPIDQNIRRFFQPDTGIAAADQINWAYASTWRAVYDPVYHAAKWAVTTGTETSPETVLCYDLETQQWTIDRDPRGFRAFALTEDSTGRQRAWKTPNAATVAGPWAMGGEMQLDGTVNHGSSAAQLVTGSTNTTLTDSGASFLTTGEKLVGIPVVALTAPPQLRVISANTGTELTISDAWDSNPAVGTRYRVGAVETRWRSAWLLFDPQARQTADVITLFWEPTATEILFYVRFFRDFGTSPILAWEAASERNGVTIPYSARTDGWLRVSSNETGGRTAIVLPQNAERAFSVEIMQFDANNPIIITGYDLEIAPKGKSNRAE